ncbi:hypothetical protein AB6A40_006683 [Gnathostoma spinigerum]|uniref:protein-ribulosamine 3-kinase n=1 Tax=Gnathostoma spinigerum TaxID=75299 RepID=A0ABD6EP88_9BILA
MEEAVKRELGLNRLVAFGSVAGGCINRGRGYSTDKLGDVFIKFNNNDGAKVMFDGEYASLRAMYLTQTIRVPKPIKSISVDGQSCLVTEYIRMDRRWSNSSELGIKLAKMHLHNSSLLAAKEKESGFIGASSESEDETLKPVTQFGFHTTTCCGFIPQKNDWNDDWVEFFAQNRLKPQVDLILEKTGDRELLSLWPELERKIPSYFKDSDKIIPSILHGDLWSGNYSFAEDGPVIFDPASFYGHSEFEMGILTMFGGFSQDFFTAYHSLIPKSEGFAERVRLYELFHHFNHW